MKLSMDTASSLGWLALDDHVIELPRGCRHSHHLAAALEELLKEHGVTPADLSAIAVGRGPGSYTGIRVAAALATGLHLGAGVPVSTFCSLQAFAPSKDGPFVVAFDARAGGAYALIGERVAGELRWDGESRRVPIEELEAMLVNAPLLVSPDPQLRDRLLVPRWCDAVPTPVDTACEGLELRYLSGAA